MKKKIIIVIFAAIILFASAIIYKVLVKRSIDITLPDNIVEVNDNKEFPGADWGLKSIVCKQGGFDILSYAGKNVTLTSSLALGKFYGITPLNINTISSNGKTICEYYSVSAGNLAPGIFSINDPNIAGK